MTPDRGDEDLTENIRIRITAWQDNLLDAWAEETDLGSRSEVVRFALGVLHDIGQGEGIVLRGQTSALLHETAEETGVPPEDLARGGAAFLLVLLKSAPGFREELDNLIQTLDAATNAEDEEESANPEEPQEP